MQSEFSFATTKSKFQQPILYDTFKYDESLDDLFDYKDLIQFTTDSGVYIIRQKSGSIFFLSANDYKRVENSFQDIKLIAAPSHTTEHTARPYCFIVGTLSEKEEYQSDEDNSEPANTIYKIVYPDEINPVYKSSFFTIFSLHANDKFLFVGSDYNRLTRIDNMDNKSHYYILCLKRVKILAISSIDDYVCIVTSQSHLIIINQDTLKTQTNITLPFSVLEDVQIKVGMIDEDYAAAILTNSIIHVISFQIDSSSPTYRSSIPAQSLISYDFHDNSIVVLRESNYSFKDFSGSTTRLSIYPRFSSDPQYEWDISKELEFIYTTDVSPSKRNKLLHDKRSHFSYVFGYTNQKSIDFPNLIKIATPRQILSLPDGNLWITSQNSLLYCVPITEEMASFRDLLNYRINYEDKCNENSTPDEIINFINKRMMDTHDLKQIFPKFDDKNENLSTFVTKKPSNIVKKLNSYLENRNQFLSIPRKVYKLMTSYMNSEIDFTVVNDSDHTKEFINQIINQFYEDNKTSSEEIADMFENSFKIISIYINNFYAITSNKMENIESMASDSENFWNSVIVGQSYQQMKYFITLLIASNLFKKFKLDRHPEIHNKYILLDSRIKELTLSYASIYNISLSRKINLKLNPLDFNYDSFYISLYKQFSDLFNSNTFLLNFVDQKSSEIVNQFDKLTNSCKPQLITLINNINNSTKQCSSETDLEAILSLLSILKDINSTIDDIQPNENLENKINKIKLINDLIDKVALVASNNLPGELINLRTTVHDIQSCIDCIHQVFNYSSTMKNPSHLLVLSMINLENGQTDAFLKYFKQFKFSNIKVPNNFYDFVIKKTENKDPKTLVSFVNEEYDNIMLDINSTPKDENIDEKISHFWPFFYSAIQIKDFDSAFNALMGLFSGKKVSILHARSLEYLITSMKKANEISKFINFPLGIHRLKILELMCTGSTTSLFIASAIYNKYKEYSKSGSVLLKYINSVLAKIDLIKTDSTKEDSTKFISDLRKAKSAVILISSLLKNHNAYIRNSSTMCLIDSRYLNVFLSKIELAILELSGKIRQRQKMRSVTQSKQAPPSPSSKQVTSRQAGLLSPKQAQPSPTAQNINISQSQSSSRTISNFLKLSPIEAANLLNYSDTVSSRLIQEFTNYFRSKKNINQQMFKFIENIRNEEALQVFLSMCFDLNMRGKIKILAFGYWLQIVFAQHNLQSMNAIIRYFLVSEKEKIIHKPDVKIVHNQEISKSYKSPQANFNFVPSERTIRNKMKKFYILCNSMIKEFIKIDTTKCQDLSILNIKPAFTLPLVYESTMKFLPLIQIYSFNSMNFHIEQKFISTNYSFSVPIEGKKSRIVCCPRGKLDCQVINDKGDQVFNYNDLQSNDFIVIKYEVLHTNDIIFTGNIKITGKDDNTEVVLVDSI